MNRSIVAALMAMVLVACGAKGATDWETDFAKASANAGKAGLYMLLDFSGSDWCGWCIRLDEEVFSQAEFKTFAKSNLVCVMVDFPRRKDQSAMEKKQNAELAAKYGIRGYPTVIVLSPEGELVGKTGYKAGGAKLYVEHLKEMIDGFKKQHAPKAAAAPATSAGQGTE